MMRLPACAKCGKSLRNKARILFEFNGHLGAPNIAWHDACARDDEVLSQAIEDFKSCAKEIPDSVFLVYKRGWGRVTYRGSRFDAAMNCALNGPG